MKKKSVQTLWMKEANNVSLEICNDDKGVCFLTGELPPILPSFSLNFAASKSIKAKLQWSKFFLWSQTEWRFE